MNLFFLSFPSWPKNPVTVPITLASNDIEIIYLFIYSLSTRIPSIPSLLSFLYNGKSREKKRGGEKGFEFFVGGVARRR